MDKEHIKRRDFLKFAGCLAAAGAMPLSLFADSSSKKLNFVFILIDDLGWADVGYNGSTFYETPNIDKLAAEGMVFTNAYAACPVCSPTRASIMTGKYPARLHLTEYIMGRRKGKVIPPDAMDHLKLEEVTVAEALKQAGYKTFIAGKWHLAHKNEKYYPEKQGFDINAGGQRQGWGWRHISPYRKLNIEDGPRGEYLADRLTDESIKFLEAQKGSDKPFFLYLSHLAVHTPLHAKRELIRYYKKKLKTLPPLDKPEFIDAEGQYHYPGRKRQQFRQAQRFPIYAAMVHSVDESVGRMLEKLDELGIADNTVVIFFSDNGGLCTTGERAPTSNLPLRAGKGWLYEGGIREPMIIKWPGVTKKGSKCDEPVTSTDFYPTLVEMAGAPLMPDQHKDGLSIVSLLKQKSETLDREAIYWHYPHYGNQGGTPGGAVRAGDYKLIEFYEDHHLELYDLKNDIGEQNDLSAEMPEKTEQLKEKLHQWRKDVGAQMPKPNPDFNKENS